MQHRVRTLNDFPVREDRRYVLYWMQANRRAESNHALVHAADLANRLHLPVLVYEALTSTYPLASARVHHFILDGVPETARRIREMGAGYVFYLRRQENDPNDVLYRLAATAAAIVTDDYPTFLPREHNKSVPTKLDCAFFAVDSSCIVPMGRMNKREYAAYTIRPKIRKMLAEYLVPVPTISIERQFKESLPDFHVEVTPESIDGLVRDCDIDHGVGASTAFRGGRIAALGRLEHFLENNLHRYGDQRNSPTARATSNLSPYLRYGMVSALEIALAVNSYGEAHHIATEEFLEELVVRRELAFNFARFSDDPGSLENLPDWARKTLRKHSGDERDPTYGREQFADARTHDDLWNATQMEMRLRGKIHGYYRMYWGKKIIEWSPTHQDALETMIYIHDRWALDGRDPNTYAGILWCFGLHDRPWQERPIFGSVRYMSFRGMKRKTDVDTYIREIRELQETADDPHRLQ